MRIHRATLEYPGQLSWSEMSKVFQPLVLTEELERTGQERIGQRWKEPDKTLPVDDIGKKQKLTIKQNCKR